MYIVVDNVVDYIVVDIVVDNVVHCELFSQGVNTMAWRYLMMFLIRSV